MTEYSQDKAVFHHDRMHVLSIAEQPNPVHVLLVISDYCTHDCSFCMYRQSAYPMSEGFGGNPKRMIPFAKIQEIVDDCRVMGVKAITLTGGGEPTVHPQFQQTVRTILDARLDLGLITHGAHLSAASIEELQRAKWVRFSLDGATAETYSGVRKVPLHTFGKVLANIANIASSRDKRQQRQLTIGVSYVVTRENYSELVQAAKLARSLGVDLFRATPEFEPGRTEILRNIDGIADVFAEVESLNSAEFKVVSQWSDRSVANAPDYAVCGYQHFTTYIGGDQNVYRCCTTSYSDRGLIGSIKEQSFAALWSSKEKRDKLAEFDARACRYCHVNDRNRSINASLTPPTHSTFV